MNKFVFVSMHSCGVFLQHVIFHTVLFQIYLTTFGFGLSFIASLTGVQLIPFMLNPIFESSSPSDFWGRRWNLVGKYASPSVLFRHFEQVYLLHNDFVSVQSMEF